MGINPEYKTVNRQRRAGVLLHPTSLPGKSDNGDLGHMAYRFIEFLNASGFKVWQMLPLGPTHEDKSPYQCLSSHAGNPMLISLEWLEDKGWLDKNKINLAETEENYRKVCLAYAADYFFKLDNTEDTESFSIFSDQHKNWLNDYALFMAFKSKYQNKPWHEWPESVRHREPATLNDARHELQVTIKQTIFSQYVFFRQWDEIRDYARQHDVELFGDMPIFVARDSADVWGQRENFLINSDGDMACIAGVPPDAFSDAGQCWGNPLYDWDYMQSSGFNWWKQRFNTQLKLFDIIRFDHFRGLQACWQIPGEDETAINGHWVDVPGHEMLSEMFKTFHYLPLVAEDLGMITEEVLELKKNFNLPGMKILQFGFNGTTDNPHLPHHHEFDDVVYTGTHDNDTTSGWVNKEQNYNRKFFQDYIGSELKTTEQAVLSMIRLAFSSVSFLSMLPMQDLLMLDSSARMNIPGTIDNNWKWRFDWEMITAENMHRLSHLLKLYER